MNAASRQRWILATVFAGTFMAPLDASIVNIALPTLGRHFGVGVTEVEWVVLAYLLITSSLLLTTGRLGDVLGYKRVYLFGFFVFTAASALCGTAVSLPGLVGYRVLQAVGASCILSTGPAILTDVFPPQRRGRALGALSVSVSLGLTTGPFLGGILVEHFGWRWIFLVNIPVGIIVLAMAMLTLEEKRSEERRRFDLAGGAAAFGMLGALLLALSQGNRWGWGSAPTVGLLLAAALLGGAFLRVEHKSPDPMLDLALFESRLFSTANASALTCYVGLFTLMFVTPFFLIEGWKLRPEQAGALLTAVPLVTAAVAPMAGALSDRIGSRALSSAGLLVIAAALGLMSRPGPGWGTTGVGVLLGTAGLGAGLFQTPNTSAIMGAVPRHRLGIASGMVATMRNVGMVLGIALSGAIMGGVAPSGASDPSFPAAISLAYRCGSLVTAVGAVLSLVRGAP